MSASHIPAEIGVCSSAAVEDDRVYFVNHRFDVMCLDVRGEPDRAGLKPKVLWTFDMWQSLGVFPCDAANGSPLIDGDVLYVQTSNGVDRNSFQDGTREKLRKIPAPNAPNLIALDKRTGRLLATDQARIVDDLLHGQWSSPSLGTVAGRKLVFHGGGDGRCYAFEPLAVLPETPVRLRTVWSFDCIPEEYKATGGLDTIVHYSLGDKRVRNTLKQERRHIRRPERNHRHAGLPG